MPQKGITLMTQAHTLKSHGNLPVGAGIPGHSEIAYPAMRWANDLRAVVRGLS